MLNLLRSGRSEVRVSSGSAPYTNSATPGSGTPGQSSVTPQESSQLTTKSTNDFWAETATALRSLVGDAPGRSVIISPQASTVAVRAMPDELRHVEAWLKATRIAVERQVMLEAKIVEVELREGFQSGIDWSTSANAAPSARPA